MFSIDNGVLWAEFVLYPKLNIYINEQAFHTAQLHFERKNGGKRLRTDSKFLSDFHQILKRQIMNIG